MTINKRIKSPPEKRGLGRQNYAAFSFVLRPSLNQMPLRFVAPYAGVMCLLAKAGTAKVNVFFVANLETEHSPELYLNLKLKRSN